LYSARGERIYEENLAHRLGVAKAALREALQNLETRVLTTKYDRRGSFVIKLMPKDIEEAYDVWRLLEPSSAVLVHRRVDSHLGNGDLAGFSWVDSCIRCTTGPDITKK
jgi:DNA-binding GntR family transcriptional regulator